MAIKRYKAEQIVTLLRQIEVGIANGKPTAQGSCRLVSLPDATEVLACIVPIVM